MEQELNRKTMVIGHRNPDTDSICSAIGYAHLKQALGENVVAARAGKVNAETKYALERFKNQALEAGLPFFKALAITADDSRWDALAESGYTHALLEPVERAAFALTVRELFEEAGFALPDNTPEAAAGAAAGMVG